MSTRSMRRQALAEWRGYKEPRAAGDGVQKIDAALAPAFKALGLGERLRESEVLAAWEGIVGEMFARHSQPSALKAGVLYVSVLQPVIHFELDRVWKKEIVRKFKERFGARVIREVRFRLG